MPTRDAATALRPLARARACLEALEHLIGGVGTATLALFALLGLLVTAVLSVFGVGLLVAPAMLRGLRAVADRERARLSRWGPEIIGPEPVPAGLKEALRHPDIHGELRWVLLHPTLGLLLGLIGWTLPFSALRDLTFPLWWYLLPPEEAAGAGLGLWEVHGLSDTLWIALVGLGWIALCLALLPGMARLQAWPGRRLLAPDLSADLALRVAQLTATRAAALDAHATELRRIERWLHDGTQNRIVAVSVMVGAARRSLARDPAAADALLERAQDAAEQALTELRGVIRGILPPVLTDRSLADALTGLAATCSVPCSVDADLPGRCAASVEATAYFVVAEALTNIAKHSGARRARVVVRRREERLLLEITDDGRGGADEHGGSGLAGIRRRTEAHDGTFMLTSPIGGPTTMYVSLPCGL